MTSDDPAPGSLTVFQSRVDRPQDASKALDLLLSLGSAARSFLDTYRRRMLRHVSEVADMEARLGPARRFVDPVFQHRVKAGLVGFFFSQRLCSKSVSFSSPSRPVLGGSSSTRQPAKRFLFLFFF